MPRSSWAHRTVQSSTSFLSPPGSLLASNSTQSARRAIRLNHGDGARLPVSASNHHRRTLSLQRTSQIPHEASEASGTNRPFPSPMISRTLSSGQMLIYLRDTALTDHTVEKFREKLTSPLGFDIEYRPNYTKGCPLNRTALVQLASESVVLLVQVSAMSAFPDTIRNIMEDPSIIKAGVGIQGDADKLWRDFGINPAGCLELSYLAKAIDQQWTDFKGRLISLSRLVKAYQDRVIAKPRHIQMSNWEQPLTEEQQDYAAGDANAALSVLQRLYVILPSVQPPPPKTLYLV